MALIRWEPVAELGTIQNEMNRLFNTFFDPPAPTGRGGAAGRRWMPAMDLIESGDHYVLRADLPGLSDDDVNVQLQDNVLTISGERNAEHEDPTRRATTGSSARSAASPAPSPSPTASTQTVCRPTSTAACLRSGSPSPNRKSPGKSRSTSGRAPPTTPKPSRAATPATRTPAAATLSQRTPNP